MAAARKPLMRIPYTDPFPAPRIIPSHATTPSAAVAALTAFLRAPSPAGLPASTVLLTGAGLSVSSGLADYRGDKGTYRVNKKYRPIYFHEFLASHEARKRYWARSFLGWTTVRNAAPNASHYAIRDLGRLGHVSAVITQNVDSFHRMAHPGHPPTVELHGYLRSAVCTTCRTELPRDAFQAELARLNPIWAEFLAEATEAGVFDGKTPDPVSSAAPSLQLVRNVRMNPDGDVDLVDAPYTTFRYPPCPHCLAHPPKASDGSALHVHVDSDGAWAPPRDAPPSLQDATTTTTTTTTRPRAPGILKPAVVMFGESIASDVKQSAESAVDGAGKLLVLATSLATYSAWRIAKRARDRGMPIGIVNMGGVRGEDGFFAHIDSSNEGPNAVRIEMATDVVLPQVVDALRALSPDAPLDEASRRSAPVDPARFRDLLS